MPGSLNHKIIALNFKETLQVSGLPSSVRMNSETFTTSEQHELQLNSSVSVACEKEKKKG